jgi:hypothetical protein
MFKESMLRCVLVLRVIDCRRQEEYIMNVNDKIYIAGHP